MENIDKLIAVIGATGGLGLAAMALVDAFKILNKGGVSRIGFHHIREVLVLFDQVLARAVGPNWELVILSHWINGRPRGEQIGVIRSLLRLGLNPETSRQLAEIGNVHPEALAVVARKLVSGTAVGGADEALAEPSAKGARRTSPAEPNRLTEAEVDLLGRVEAAVEARLDAAFDLADQRYRNVSRVLAGLIAVALALFASLVMPGSPGPAVGFLLGLLAVPIAPIAKDLVSALTAAAGAVKAARKA